MKKLVLQCLMVTLLSACGGSHESLDGRAIGASGDSSNSSEMAQSEILLRKAADLNRIELVRANNKALSNDLSGISEVKAGTSNRVTAYRFYNVQTGAHFYTTSETERQSVQNTLWQFKYEGPAFNVSRLPVAGLSPVYRFYNNRTGIHFYTISDDERAFLQVNLPQFVYEGVAYYASKTGGPDFVPLYRFYVGSKGYHFYSGSAAERDRVAASLPDYRYEGTSFFTFSSELFEPTGPGVGSDTPYDGVGAIYTDTCGNYTIDTSNPFPCCGVRASNSSGNCTWFAWAKAYEVWGIKLNLPQALESSFSSDLYYFNGQRRRALRYKAEGALLATDPTNSAFAWAHIARNQATQGLSVSSTPVAGSIGVSSPSHPDGHVAWVTAVVQDGGRTYVDTLEQICSGASGIPTRPMRRLAAYFDQGFITFADVTARPGEFRMLRAGTSSPSNAKFIEWTESVRASEYRVLLWRYPNFVSISESETPPGTPEVLISGISASARRVDFTYVLESGYYVFKVQAVNSNGNRLFSSYFGVAP